MSYGQYVATMSELSSYKDRQEDEVEVLQAVFFNPGDFQDLRENDNWKVNTIVIAIVILCRVSIAICDFNIRFIVLQKLS